MVNMLSQNFWLKGLVGLSQQAADGSEVTARFTRDNALVMATLYGDYGEQNQKGKVFAASVAAVTIPVNAATLVSVFTLYNPVGSNILMELIDLDLIDVLATTVVGGIGLYSSTAALTALGTFTTKGNPRSGRVQDGAQNVGLFYSAFTHSGTPTLECLCGGYGAVTYGGTGLHYNFEGKIIIPPGIAVSLASTTAAETASGTTAMMSWLERPV